MSASSLGEVGGGEFNLFDHDSHRRSSAFRGAQPGGRRDQATGIEFMLDAISDARGESPTTPSLRR